MLRKLLISSTALISMIVAASAADLPSTKDAPAYVPPPVLSWTGFYAGVNAGWGSLHDDGHLNCYNPEGAYYGNGCGLLPNLHPNANGFIGGGQIGYNWQLNQIVLGVETDFQGATFKGSSSFSGAVDYVGGGNSGPGTLNVDESLSWLGTARARLGFLVTPTLLLYGTGGLAYGKVDVDYVRAFPSGDYSSSASPVKAGWVAGGGAEYAITNNWSVKVEGLFYDLGSVTTSNGSVPIATGFTLGKTFGVQGEIVRAGVNYKFDFLAPPAPVVAKY
ncbi:porin family protein [Methylovirgula ligni]|uniref:Outer membrane immunogenic protein n=1 Tax=Methylovirgula ligni TaxID=569860 RepID=A0A3D9Z220_9HYPH|nr:outer membrane protein [Methylovirgula ligni]QAY96817.1 porin family protein [Methylovirgula ligni]REF88148.1 outer membrane immunogenic protein [Methylovirgula ligni]